MILAFFFFMPDQESLDIYIKYKPYFKGRDLSKLLSSFEALHDEVLSALNLNEFKDVETQEVFKPSLIVEEIKTGNSINLKFKLVWESKNGNMYKQINISISFNMYIIAPIIISLLQSPSQGNLQIQHVNQNLTNDQKIKIENTAKEINNYFIENKSINYVSINYVCIKDTTTTNK